MKIFDQGQWLDTKFLEDATQGSNWPFKDYPERSYDKDEWIFFVDNEEGVTVAQFQGLQNACKFAKKYGGIVRPWQQTTEEIEAENAARRQAFRLGFRSRY